MRKKEKEVYVEDRDEMKKNEKEEKIHTGRFCLFIAKSNAPRKAFSKARALSQKKVHTKIKNS